jgi:hypothetical protein
MSKTISMVLIAGIVFGQWAVFSAQPTNETFTGGSNGWVGTTASAFGSFGIWSFTGGAARVLFPNPGFPVPENATLSNTPSASSGSFTGNYDAVGIATIGFSFLAPQIVPSGFVVLEWAGSTSVFQRGFTVATAGVWYHFTASLADVDRHQWTTLLGSSNDFAAARQSVKYVTIRFSRNGLLEHQFIIDDVFLAGQPGGASISRDFDGMIRWDSLVAGVGYQVQSTTNLIAAPWVAVESLTATGVLHTTIITNSARETESFRIRFQ